MAIPNDSKGVVQETNRERPHVLVVDDDDRVLSAVRHVLEEEYEVTATTSPIRALQTLKEGLHDILLADLSLEEMDGIELIRAAKNIRPSLVAIMLTGHASQNAAVAALKEGAFDFLEKPVSPTVLRHAIGRAWDVIRADLGSRQLEQPRVLVVDDDDILLRSVRDILKDRYNVTTAQSGEQALQALKEKAHEILLTDLVMEEMSGVEVIRSAKSIRPSLTALVMTGYASKDAAVEALRAGAYDFLEKPLTPNMVVQAVDRAWKAVRTELENRRLLVELRRANEEIEATAAAERKKAAELRKAYDELRETQSLLIQAEKMTALGQLAAGIAHELNLPLNNIKLIMQSRLRDIEKDRHDVSDLTSDSKEVVGLVNRMAEIIDHMRVFTRKTERGVMVDVERYCQ